MAEEEDPPRYDDGQPNNTVPVSKSVLVTITHRKPDKNNEINISARYRLQEKNDIISIATTATRNEIFSYLWERARLYMGSDVVPELKTRQTKLGVTRETDASAVLWVDRDGKRVSILDEATWEAAKGWVFDGTAALHYDFVVRMTVVQRSGSVKRGTNTDHAKGAVTNSRDDTKKQKGCVVQ